MVALVSPSASGSGVDASYRRWAKTSPRLLLLRKLSALLEYSRLCDNDFIKLISICGDVLKPFSQDKLSKVLLHEKPSNEKVEYFFPRFGVLYYFLFLLIICDGFVNLFARLLTFVFLK